MSPAAAELEKAAEMYAKEPMPQMVLKSNGTNLTPERITKLLESWKASRSTRSTAFLNADVDVCLSLDMDEVPEFNFFHTVRETWEPGTGRGWVWWDTGNKWRNNNRLHAREGYRWIKPCHEVTFRYAEGEEKTLEYDLTVFHIK